MIFLKYLISILCVLIFSCTFVDAGEKPLKSRFIIDLQLYDTAYNSNFSAQNPSMTQALQLSKAFYQFSHDQLQSFWGENTDASLLSIILFDTIATWLPLSNGWLHEEWHRAVMGQYDIKSRNDIYDLQLFKETISVSRVTDTDLISFKKNHVTDFIRLHTAGLESQNQFNMSVEYDQFYENTKTNDNLLLWFNTINTTAYLNTCSTRDSNRITNNILSKESQDISSRDFTGLDCNAWVYDLFRPDEAYESRGEHPSGVGINRYITYDKLNEDERRFLRKQYYLSFLNFIDPFLLKNRGFSFQKNQTGIVVNGNVKHYLTPFGYSLHLHTFLKIDNKNFLISFNHYVNRNRYFPGFDFSFINRPFQAMNHQYSITTKLQIWQQPNKLSFTSNNATVGGSVATKVELNLTKRFSGYLHFLHKSVGWQAGNLYLSKRTSLVFGFRYRV